MASLLLRHLGSPTPPASASLNKPDYLYELGSSQWTFVDQVVNALMPSESTEMLEPVCPSMSDPRELLIELLCLFFNSFISLSLPFLSVFLNARDGRDFKDHSSVDR